MDKRINSDPRAWWLRALLIIGPLGLGALLLLATRKEAIHWLGVAFCGLGIYSLIPEWISWHASLIGEYRIRRFTFQWTTGSSAVLALCIVAAALLWPSLLGMMPQSQDHPMHLTRLWHFINNNLFHFQLSGWTDLWFAGWPSGEDYPPGADMWSATLYLVTFGLLGWEATYGLAFTAMYAVVATGIYTLGKTYFGRLTGFAAGLFFLLDRGHYREGGWNYTVYWGVWPQVLCTGFTCFAFAALDNVIKKGRPRDFALCATLTGFAIISHPISVVYFGIGLPTYLLARGLGTDEKANPMVARTLTAFAMGGALAAFWLLPYITKSMWFARYGELWKSLPSIASGLWQGNVFNNVAPPILWLAMMGAVLAAWRRKFAGIFLVGFGGLVLFLSSSSAFRDLDLMNLSSSFGNVQYQRLSILVKVCFFLLAGFALQISFAQIKSRPFRWRGYFLAALLILVCSPFVKPLATEWGKTYGAEIGRPKTRKQVPHWKEYQEFLRWSAELKRKEKGFYRIAYVRPYNDHFFGAAPVYNQTPSYKVGYTPAATFVHKPDTNDPELYRLLSVKYVVTVGSQHGSHLEHLKRFGAINVYRHKAYSPQRYTLKGPGTVEVKQFDSEEIKLKLSGTTEKSKLVLHVANYANWKAYGNDGKSIPIETVALAEHEHFIGLKATQNQNLNGEIEIRYTWPAINMLGAGLSWFVIAILMLMLVGKYRPQATKKLNAKFTPWWNRVQRHGIALGVLAVILGGALLAFKSSGKAALPKTFSAALGQAKVEVLTGDRSQPCRREGPRKHQCSNKSWNYVGPVHHPIANQLRRCIWAHPIDGKKLRVNFPNVKLGRVLSGHHGIIDSAVRSFPSGRPVDLAVAIDGQQVGQFKCSNKKGWKAWEIDTSSRAGKKATVTFTISTTRAAGRHYCFEGEMR
jgi:hypothetical protein